MKLEVHADSAAAIGIGRRSGIGRVRPLAVGQLWVQEKLREGCFFLRKSRWHCKPGRFAHTVHGRQHPSTALGHPRGLARDWAGRVSTEAICTIRGLARLATHAESRRGWALLSD